MADTHTAEARSYNMSKIRSKDTAPEVLVRKHLFSHGFRYRKNVRKMYGSPDIVLPKYKTVIFVNGCFWHKHNCSRFVWPSSNQEYWKEKITRNVERDRANYSCLEKEGWNVIVVWECQLNKKNIDNTMDMLIKSLRENDAEH